MSPDKIRCRLKTKSAVPDAPGLGMELDWKQVRKDRHEAYKRLAAVRVTTQVRCRTSSQLRP